MFNIRNVIRKVSSVKVKSEFTKDDLDLEDMSRKEFYRNIKKVDCVRVSETGGGRRNVNRLKRLFKPTPINLKICQGCKRLESYNSGCPIYENALKERYGRRLP